MFAPHHNLSDQINGNIIRSEIEGGVDLRHLPPESTLEVETRNRAYIIANQQRTNRCNRSNPRRDHSSDLHQSRSQIERDSFSFARSVFIGRRFRCL